MEENIFTSIKKIFKFEKNTINENDYYKSNIIFTSEIKDLKDEINQIQNQLLKFIENLLEVQIENFSYIYWDDWKTWICFDSVKNLKKDIYMSLLWKDDYVFLWDKFVFLFD